MTTLLAEPPLAKTSEKPSLIDLNDPSLPATLELLYLRPLLEQLPASYCFAVDVGAHKGDITELLLDIGYNVVAVEPQPALADRLARRMPEALADGRLSIERVAASDRTGTAQMIVGRASTVSTLEPTWTTVAFPEEFTQSRTEQVPTRRLADVRTSHGLTRVGFVKIDVEGHELPALQGLFDSAAEPPAVVMFEANQRFTSAAEDCLALLASRGYGRFDVIIREGVAPIAAERFIGPRLPRSWHACDTVGRYFYANIIAYHDSVIRHVDAQDQTGRMLDAFMQAYHVAAARRVLASAARHEADHAVPVNPEWQSARRELCEHLRSTDDWSDFLQHPICRHMFVRGRWSEAQDAERAALQDTDLGRRLLTERDPAVGSPRLSDRLPGLSTNTLGMAWYIDQIARAAGGTLPASVLELGGGYGAFARLYATYQPAVAYLLLDLPEMLALQHYYLSQALPGTTVRYGGEGPIEPKSGTITLVPISRLPEVELSVDLFVSTFAYSELPADLQTAVRLKNWFNARQLFLTGQLACEAPEASWVDAGQLISGVVTDFPRTKIDRYHIGHNYMLNASR